MQGTPFQLFKNSRGKATLLVEVTFVHILLVHLSSQIYFNAAPTHFFLTRILSTQVITIFVKRNGK